MRKGKWKGFADVYKEQRGDPLPEGHMVPFPMGCCTVLLQLLGAPVHPTDGETVLRSHTPGTELSLNLSPTSSL